MFKTNKYVCLALILSLISFYGVSSFADDHYIASSAVTWDLDSNGEADALTDGLLLLRYSFGMRGESLTNGAVSSGSSLSQSDLVARIEASLSIADIDGNSEVDALTDSLLLLRYLFGLEGDTLINGAVSSSATRISADQISQYILAKMPGEMPVDSDNDGVNDTEDAFPNDPSETADSDNDGVGDNSDTFPNDASETADTDNDGVGNNADAFPNDPNETEDLNNNGIGDNADANASSGPQSDFCSSPLYHLGMEAEVLSKVNLSIENIGNNKVRVSIVSADSSAVDVLIVEGGSGASIIDDTSASGGAYAKLLSWSNAMPDNAIVTILWSKTSSGGNWIERDIPVVTAATCSGGNSGGGSDGNGSGGTGSNPSDPNNPDADVLSIFSDDYSDISGVNFNPSWGQSTIVTNANGVLIYQNLNYQGTTFGGPKDVSGYEYLHIDILPENSSTFKLFLINSADVTGGDVVETYFELNVSVNQWNSIDIPLSSFSAVVDLAQVDQIKIEGTGNVTLDNLYFGGISENNNGGSGNSGDNYTGGGNLPTEEIAVANGILVGGVNSSNPGFTVYLFDDDSSSESTCYGGCASAWPPVYVEDDSASGVSNLGSIIRNDGTEQVTYNGMPLYYYAGDQAPGDRSGDEVSLWHSIEYGNIGPVNMLFSKSTPLEPETTFTRNNGVIVTRIADRGRDRHAKDTTNPDGSFNRYDHYLAHYWQFRTMRIQLEDYVPAGQSLIKVTWITESALGAKEFRVWYSGQNTTGQFWFNPQPQGQQANPNESAVVSHGSGTWNDDFEKISSTGHQHKYTLNIVNRWQLGGQIQEPLQLGMDMEFEASMFLLNPPAGSRLNYYGTSFVYKIGQPGMHPFEWEVGQQDGTPIPDRGRSGGGTTLGYNYSEEPAGRFMQMATNMAPGNAEPFVLGRRVHHTSFVNGVHGERHDNPVWHSQKGKAGKRYVSESCASCHVRNGKALVADVGQELEKWVFNVGDENGNPLSSIGRVLQPYETRLVNTNEGAKYQVFDSEEGTVTLGPWTEYTEGEFAGLRSPNYQFSNGTPPQFSARIAPQLVGIGLLEAVDETTIISWADDTDEDNNLISGRASMVEDPISGEMRLGRFGYKAATFSVKHQIASAFNTDMDVMTSMLPTPDCGSAQTDCGNGSSSELADEHVDNLVKYVSLLGVGARRDYKNQGGESLFHSIGCADCHRPSMVTSNNHPLAELRGQTIYPYTDMLLHDMGEGLADNLAEGSASGAEWRTAPLWGLGLVKNVMLGDAKGNDLVSEARDYPADLNRIGYLHDGRARNIDEAIRWHGGEANNSKNAYEALTDVERDAVIDFLESL